MKPDHLSPDLIAASAGVGIFTGLFPKIFPDASLAIPLVAVCALWVLAFFFGYAVAFLNGEQFSKDKGLRSFLRMLAYLSTPLAIGLFGLLFHDTQPVVAPLQWMALGAAGTLELLSLLKQFAVLGVPVPPPFKALLLGKWNDMTKPDKAEENP